MAEASEYLRNKILRLELEHKVALAKANEYRLKANEQDQRAQELEVMLRHLKNWTTTDFGLRDEITSSVDGSIRAYAEPESLPIRDLVVDYLRENFHFSPRDLIATLQAKHPDAKASSIAGALSRCKKRGEVLQISKRVYESGLYQKTDEVPLDNGSTDLLEDSGTENEYFDDEVDSLAEASVSEAETTKNETASLIG